MDIVRRLLLKSSDEVLIQTELARYTVALGVQIGISPFGNIGILSFANQ